jgi:hypothetical protein
MDKPLISLFRSSCLTRESPRSPVWAAPEVDGQVLARTSCSPRLHYAEWLCVVLNDSPRRHNGSGRDWPDKSRSVYRSSSFWWLTLPWRLNVRVVPLVARTRSKLPISGHNAVCKADCRGIDGTVATFRVADDAPKAPKPKRYGVSHSCSVRYKPPDAEAVSRATRCRRLQRQTELARTRSAHVWGMKPD